MYHSKIGINICFNSPNFILIWPFFSAFRVFRQIIYKSEAFFNSSPIEELAEAADKITLMSPEVFSAAKSSAPQIKEEPATPVDVSPPKRGAAIAMAAMASGGSSPSREVQDILGDTEEQGGLGAEIGKHDKEFLVWNRVLF